MKRTVILVLASTLALAGCRSAEYTQLDSRLDRVESRVSDLEDNLGNQPLNSNDSDEEPDHSEEDGTTEPSSDWMTHANHRGEAVVGESSESAHWQMEVKFHLTDETAYLEDNALVSIFTYDDYPEGDWLDSFFVEPWTERTFQFDAKYVTIDLHEDLSVLYRFVYCPEGCSE